MTVVGAAVDIEVGAVGAVVGAVLKADVGVMGAVVGVAGAVVVVVGTITREVVGMTTNAWEKKTVELNYWPGISFCVIQSHIKL
jgi:hypothetical protein